MRQTTGREIVAIAVAVLGCARAPSEGRALNAPPISPASPPPQRQALARPRRL
jgi:hypothetical protein